MARRAVRVVSLPEGGFPIENLAYWKEVVTNDNRKLLHVQFKSGGFIELDMTSAQFTSLVYGEPF